MKKMMTHWKRLVAACLITALFFTSCEWPLQVQAEEIEQSQTEQEKTEEKPSEDPYILCEDEERRDETTKHFIMSDGSRRAVKYSQPVHYEENGQWKDIDNTLEYDESEKKYGNRAASFHVKFDENPESDQLLFIENKGYTVSWKYISKNLGKQKQKAKKKKRGKPEDKYNVFVQEVTDGLSYEEIDEACDIEYVVTGTGVKENIILNAPTQQNEFQFRISAKDMIPEQKDDGSISFLAAETMEEVFYIPAPFMYDANDVYSDAVYYDITEEKNGKYILTINADETWLSDEERAYPVVIDPIITTRKDKADIDSVFIASDSDYKNTNFAEYRILSIGWDTSAYGRTRTLVQFDLPTLNRGDMVIGASLAIALYHKSFYTSSMANQQIDAHVITEKWNQSTVTWNNKPAYDSVVYDYDYIKQSDVENSTNWKQFDITKAVKGWYEGTIANNGIMIRQHDESGTMVSSVKLFYA